MKKCKKFTAIVISMAMMMLTLIGCGEATQESTEQKTATGGDVQAEASDKEHIKIAYTLEQLTEGISLTVDMTQEWIDNYNAGDNPYYIDKVDYYSADYVLDNQLAAIEDIIVKDYDVLMISALDNTAVLNSLREAHDAGIKVIDTRGDLEGDFIDVSVNALDNAGMGQEIKAMIKEYLEANPDVVLNTGIMWHEQSVTSCLPRCSGIKELAEEMPDRVKIVAEIYTSETSVAQDTMEDWIQAYPEMNYVACSMDESALGVVNALKTANIKPGEILVSSIDGSATGVNLLKEGYLDFLVGFSLKYYGECTIECAYKSFTGEYETGYKFINDDIRRITKDMDLDAYLEETGWK